MNDGAKSLGLLLALLAGFGGGILAALLVNGGEATAANAGSLPAVDPALAPELRALAAEVAALRQQLRQAALQPAPAATDPQPLAPARDDTALVAALERLAASMAGDGADAALVLPAPDAGRHARAVGLLARRDDDLAAACRLWPAQRVLDEFGLPDEIYVVDNSEKWIWRSRPEEALALVLFRGHVVGVERW